MVNTRFWDDSYVIALTPIEKLLFLYLLTNPLTAISGVYELPLRRMIFDTGLEGQVVQEILEKLERDRKLIYEGGWVGITNWIKHQNLRNDQIRKGICSELKKAPITLIDRLSTDYGLCMSPDESSHLNLNSNPNQNLNPKRGIRISLESVFDNVKKIAVLPTEALEDRRFAQ